MNDSELIAILKEIKQCSCKEETFNILSYLPNVASGIFALLTSVILWKLIIGTCLYGWKEIKKCYYGHIDEEDKNIICNYKPKEIDLEIQQA